MTIVSGLFFFLYCVLVVALMRGWHYAVRNRIPTNTFPAPFLSVVIPIRNEGHTIANLLIDICNQSYKNFEVILVNDHSKDNTCDVIAPFILGDNRIKLINNTGEGKKVALTEGINGSRGDIIITTDGDCRINSGWLFLMTRFFQDDNTKMVFGGVRIEGNSFFSILQSHEFLSLIGTSAATLSLGFPTMCNGANLAFRKSVFKEVGGYAGTFHIPSGDDEHLMRKVFKRYPHSIVFANHPDTVVSTSAAPNINQFIQQRIRWAGKWKHGTEILPAFLAIFIFCFQSIVILVPFGMLMGRINIFVGLLMLSTKIFMELIFFRPVSAFLGVRWSWRAFILLQLVYPIYVLLIGCIANFSSFEWKERKLKSLSVSMIKKFLYR